jgi:hypothetical protein
MCGNAISENHSGCKIRMLCGKDFVVSDDQNALSSKKFSDWRKRLLPREHGATAIWFASMLLTFGTLREPPAVLGVVVFLTAAVLALVIIGRFTNGSKALVRLERNPTLLPVLSAIVTLIVPLGHLIMVGLLSFSALVYWLVFLTYCSSGVVYIQGLVRSVLRDAPPAWTGFYLSTAFILALIVTLNALTWISLDALAITVPLTVHRAVALLLIQRRSSSRIDRIRGIGFAQAGNLIAATIILSVVWRF